jgi:hypothetical protein
VFLGLSFRELARLHGVAHGKWPDTAQLRRILYGQLRGMDINGSALNLAALTLYLTAVELDASPLPPEKLRFDKQLLGNVLFDVDTPHEGADSGLGSLREDCPAGSEFDVVIANPPWTSASTKSVRGHGLTRSIEVLAKRTLAERAPHLKEPYTHPDNVPDIAFAWKATTWARKGGIIALLLHHRLLIKRSPSWRAARNGLFACMEVSGIVNAGEFALHHRLIWPGMEQPFCILFARNQPADIDHRMTVLTPVVEPALKARRQLRLDPQATVQLDASQFDGDPNTLTVLAKASEMDLAFLRRWIARESPNVSGSRPEIAALPMASLKRCLASIQTRPPARGMKLGGALSTHMTPDWYTRLPSSTLELPASAQRGFVDLDTLPRFRKRPVRSTPGLDYYASPLSLLIREAPGNLDERARAFLLRPGNAPVVYPYSYLGTPVSSDKEGLLRAKYICLWINSSLFAYFQTLTASRFAFGIKVLNDAEILAFPMVNFDDAQHVRPDLASETNNLFERWAAGDQGCSSNLDEWVCELAGFSAADQELVSDTLSDCYPIGAPRNSGYQWVDRSLIDSFAERVRTEVQEVAPDAIESSSVKALEVSTQLLAGWRFLTWRPRHAPDPKTTPHVADTTEASLLELVRVSYPQGQVWAVTSDGWCVMGQLALRRFWLPSRAPLLAAMIVAWADLPG